MSCKWVFCVSVFARVLQSAGSLDANASDGQMRMMRMMIHSTGIWGSYPEPSKRLRVHESPAVPDGEIIPRLFDQQQTKATSPRVELTEAGGVCLKDLSRVWPRFVSMLLAAPCMSAKLTMNAAWNFYVNPCGWRRQRSKINRRGGKSWFLKFFRLKSRSVSHVAGCTWPDWTSPTNV